MGTILVLPQLHADQTIFNGSFSGSGIRSGGGCTTPGPFTITATALAAVQPSLASLAANGGTASGVLAFTSFGGSGCNGNGGALGGPVSASVSPGGATTIVLTVSDGGGNVCAITLKGTTSSQSGDATSCLDGTNLSATLSLTAQASTPPAATLRVTPAALQFTAVAGGGATPAQTLNVLNDTDFQLSATGQWTGSGVSSVNGKVFSFQEIFVQTGGSFSGALAAPNGRGGFDIVPISGTVVGSSFSFFIDAGKGESITGSGSVGGNTATASYTDTTPGQPTDFGTVTFTRQSPAFTPVPALAWTQRTVVLTGFGGWLVTSPAGGTATAGSAQPSTITASANPSGLAPGQYSGTITITAPGAANSPVVVSVLLTVLPSASVIAAQTQPTGLIFVGGGATAPAAQTVQVTTASSSSVTVNVSSSTTNGGNWLVSDKNTAALSNGAPVTLNISASTTGLPAGVYRGQVALNFSDGSSPQFVQVILVIPAAGPAPAVKLPVEAACTASTLLAVDRTLGTNFQSLTSWPTTLDALVVDDCGVLSTGASVLASFSNGDPAVTLQALGSGEYQATWRPVNSGGTVTVTVTASQPPLKPAVVTLTGKVSDNPNVPAIFSGGMVGAASYSGVALPPGGIISVFGKNLAQTGAASSLPLPTSLGGLTLTAAGQNLPMFYSSSGQVNAQLPSELAAGTRIAVVAKATVNGAVVLSVPEVITVGPAAPGIFTVSQDGKGQGVIVDANNRLVDGKQTTATAGQVVVIYCTGLGATTPPVASGVAAPGGPLAQVMPLPVVTMGGVPAPVQFAGLTPGLVGLYQINAVIPAGVTGAAVNVTITHQGVTSNTVTMAVR